MTATIQAPADACFRTDGIQDIGIPHPYCITEKHVCEASDNHSGILNEAAIEAAERHGAKCGVRGCRLPYSQHETQKTLIVVLKDDAPRDLNKVPGLVEWLCGIKDEAIAQGVQGFAFPREKDRRRTG